MPDYGTPTRFAYTETSASKPEPRFRCITSGVPRWSDVKRPAFQFYPADWRKDLELGACSYVARGIWFEMLCVMHEAQPYGFMVRDGRAIPDQAAANLVRAPLRVYIGAVDELEANGVLSRSAEGLIFSRRMVRDEHLRNVRSSAGKLGGNPNLLNQKTIKPPDEVNQPVKQVPTPSASSASSSSTASSKPAVERTPNVNARANGSHGRVKTSKNNSKTESWSTPAWVDATAKTLGLERRNGERAGDFADRIHSEVESRRRKAAAGSRRLP